MKCDELKEYKAYEFGTSYVYHILEVREAIAELKAKLDEKDKELESLKASHYAEMVDAGMRECRLCRALCLLRFAFSKLEQNYISRFEYNESKWDEMWEKRANYWKAKSEEYK